MKRFIRIVALFMCVVTLFTGLASAAEVDNINFINLLDFTTANNSGSNSIYVADEGNVTFDFPSTTRAGYVEFLFTSVQNVNSVKALYRDTTFDLVVMALDAYTYRAYGNLNYGPGDSIALQFDLASAGTIQFFSANISAMTSHYGEVGKFSLYWQSADGLSHNDNYVMPSSETPILSDYMGTEINTSDEGYFVPYPFQAGFSCDNWEKYDFIDFHFRIKAHSVDSLSVYSGSIPLPFSVSMFDTSLTTSTDKMEQYWQINSNGELIDEAFFDKYWSEVLTNATLDITVRVDVRGLNRTSATLPVVDVRGSLPNTDNNFVYLLRCSGFVDSVTTNPLLLYFSDLKVNLASLFSDLSISINKSFASINDSISRFHVNVGNWFAGVTSRLDELIHSDTSGSEEFEDDISSQATEMEDISETLDSVTKPPVDDFDVSIDQFFEGDDISAYASPLSAFFDNAIFIVMFLMSMIAVTVSYVFYGKR